MPKSCHLSLPRVLGLLALAMALCARAASPVADGGLEPRVQRVAEQLRCLVCQNQTVAESHAQLALDLKNEVRDQLAQGRSEQQILDFMVQRYGDFVLYRPPFKSITWMLWVGPFALLAVGLVALFHQVRQNGFAEGQSETEELS